MAQPSFPTKPSTDPSIILLIACARVSTSCAKCANQVRVFRRRQPECMRLASDCLRLASKSQQTKMILCKVAEKSPARLGKSIRWGKKGAILWARYQGWARGRIILMAAGCPITGRWWNWGRLHRHCLLEKWLRNGSCPQQCRLVSSQYYIAVLLFTLHRLMSCHRNAYLQVDEMQTGNFLLTHTIS